MAAPGHGFQGGWTRRANKGSQRKIRRNATNRVRSGLADSSVFAGALADEKPARGGIDKEIAATFPRVSIYGPPLYELTVALSAEAPADLPYEPMTHSD